MAINYQRASELLLEMQKQMLCTEFKRLHDSVTKLVYALEGTIPWDWRYNSTYWALDVADLCNEIGYSIAWMRSFAAYSSECDEQTRRVTEGRVSYYADNAATRISSCRDKLGLTAWSYYCPFNPDRKEEVLTFEQVRLRLTSPIRFGLQLTGHEEFLSELNKLVGPNFQRATAYRNGKVHRREPRVMMRKPEQSDERCYMVPLMADSDIGKFDEKLREMYPEDPFRQRIRENCFRDGVLYDRRAPDQLLWHFEEFDEFTHGCWRSLCDATAGSCEILLSREPILSKGKPSDDF